MNVKETSLLLIAILVGWYWTLSLVPVGATGEVNVNFKVPTTTLAHAPLVVAAALRNSARQILAQASDANATFAIFTVTKSFWDLDASGDGAAAGTRRSPMRWP